MQPREGSHKPFDERRRWVETRRLPVIRRRPEVSSGSNYAVRPAIDQCPVFALSSPKPPDCFRPRSAVPLWAIPMAFDRRMPIGRVKFPLYTRETREAAFAHTVSGKAEGRLSTRSCARKRLTMRDDARDKKQRTVAILLRVLCSAGIMIAAPTFLQEKGEVLRDCAGL